MMNIVTRSNAKLGRLVMLLFFIGLVLLIGVEAGALTPKERLDQARRDYLIGLATEQRIAGELARYKASNQTSAEVIALYETYLDRVRRLTEEKRRVLERLETRRGPKSATPTRPHTATDATPASHYDPEIPEDQELDEINALEQELERSLAAYDDMLLREIEISRVQSELKMQKLAREAAQAAKSLREQGQMEGSEGAETGLKEGRSSQGAGNETDEMQDEREGEHQQAEGASGSRDKTAAQESSGEGRDLAQTDTRSQQGAASGEAGKPDEDARYQDDDIVARQLREAAEKETDPELKEKLWKEYHDYKKSL